MDLNLCNEHFQKLDVDYLYHLGIDTSYDLEAEFGQIDFMFFTSTNEHARVIANAFQESNKANNSSQTTILEPICKTERFHIYKVGKYLISSFGVGIPSLLICLNEFAKLFVHLRKFDINFIKLDLADGIGLSAGGLVIMTEALNSKFAAKFTAIECGCEYDYLTGAQNNLSEGIFKYCRDNYKGEVVLGKVLTGEDYYEGMARYSGALDLPYTRDDCNEYLLKAYDCGVRAFDISSTGFSGFCNELNLSHTVIDVLQTDRLQAHDNRVDSALGLELLSEVAGSLRDFLTGIN